MGRQELDEARRLCDRGAWRDAWALLVAVDAGDLGPQDHENLAVAASLTTHDDLGLDSWERAHHAWLAVGNVPRATRCAVWLGMSLQRQGQYAPASGWFARAERLLEDSGIACAEQARLLVPAGLAVLSRDPARAFEVFAEAGRIVAEHPDPEVEALVRLGTGQALVQLGKVEAGVRLLDEAMVATTTGDVSPIAVGIVYCAVILECHRIFDVQRARQWTAELDRWSSQLQGLVPFRGQCLVHRSEMAQLRGDWVGAVEEAESACEHLADPSGDPALGMALYQRGELHRLRGEFDAADTAYTQAVECGHRDVPGRQLLLLGRGRTEEAAGSIRVALEQARSPVQRARVLAAHVEIMLATGDVDAARESSQGLRALSADFTTGVLDAVASRAAAMVELAAGHPREALGLLHDAMERWRALGVPYEVGRVHALEAKAYAALGDDAGARVARSAAHTVFASLGAVPDLEGLVALDEAPALPTGGLSPRELEVLGLIANGSTNRQVAQRLVISEKTVARHVSNIFVKLGVSSRSAATAWAWEHGLAR